MGEWRGAWEQDLRFMWGTRLIRMEAAGRQTHGQTDRQLAVSSCLLQIKEN